MKIIIGRDLILKDASSTNYVIVAVLQSPKSISLPYGVGRDFQCAVWCSGFWKLGNSTDVMRFSLSSMIINQTTLNISCQNDQNLLNLTVSYMVIDGSLLFNKKIEEFHLFQNDIVDVSSRSTINSQAIITAEPVIFFGLR